ncbi:tripartite motif containing 38 [Phyllostomus discolor]|uniref:Tripartite motif containing 38 n=1 Tax=Phyllostomus discolor TaxID=89673 RepID=A0A833YIN4_9CHIR|nr:tripartite motif containing 38 [Phyllostomus discolor]
MASATSSKKMREEATCSICLNLMVEPMSISCGHSYCQACILRFLDNQPRPPPALPQVSPCPQCRAPFQRASLRPNKQLGGLIEALREMDCDVCCEEHNERLQLFCEDEGQLICWRCERAPRHQGHSTALVEDVCPGYKEKLQKAMTKLRQLEEECVHQKASRGKQITEWNVSLRVLRLQLFPGPARGVGGDWAKHSGRLSEPDQTGNPDKKPCVSLCPNLTTSVESSPAPSAFRQ